MPYISQDKRKNPDMIRVLRAINRAVESGAINSRGDMNFVAFSMSLNYVHKKGESYENHSDVCSFLTDCSEEYRRRYMNPYEDLKIEENGDI